MATAAAAVPAISMKRPAEDYLDHSVGDEDKEVPANSMALLNSLSASAAANKRLRTEDPMNSLGSLVEQQKENMYEEKDQKEPRKGSEVINGAIPTMTAAHRGFPCVWMDGTSPGRDAEGGEKSPNPPPPQLALPLETEGASTERSLHLTPSPRYRGDAGLDMKRSPLQQSTPLPPLVIQPVEKNGPPRNPFEDRPGLEHLFKAGLMNGNHSDSEASNGDADSQAVEVCPECQKVFKRKVYLQRHMEREHWSTAKVFKCEDCSYETKHQSNLSVHRRTHTGERPYHCGCCGQRYTQGHLLKSHIRSRHSGNMEFYNLDKKSDSTRGRKSLDLKHENPLAGPKVDKISALLQAAAASNGSQRSPVVPPMPKFGNLLPPPMTGFPYFGGLRPMMSPSMSLANSLLGGPRFFTIGGMPNGLHPSATMLPGPGLPNMANPTSPNSGLNLSTGMPLVHPHTGPMSYKDEEKVKEEKPKTERGIKVPVKVPEMAQEARRPRIDDVAQDLTKKRAEKASHEEESTRRAGLPSEPELPMATSPSLQNSHSGTSLFTAEAMYGSREGLTNGHMSSPSPASTPTRPSESVCTSDDELLKNATPEPDEAHYNFLQPAMMVPGKCRHGNRSKGEDPCPHLKKLQNLRRNVFRMLSTFTPDLSEENGITNDGDEVDELLHEVIYSNIDEDFMSAKD